MGTFRAGIVTLVAIAVGTMVLTQFFAPDDATEGVPSPVGSAKAQSNDGSGAVATTEVSMKDLKFAPAAIAVDVGATVTWTNDDPLGHTVTPVDAAQWGSEGSGSDVDSWLQQGDEWSFTFEKAGTYAYFCVPHASKGADGTYAGMTGVVYVGVDAPEGGDPAFEMPTTSVVPSPVAPARSLPDADGIVRITLETREVTARLADGVAYTFWTFDGTVPGPMLRVQAGDTVELTLTNADDSTMVHSIDLHAVTGPGGGAVATQTQPGSATSFTFKALNPGLFVYHCATPHIPSHIANGMYGLILVEPEGGLPPVDREYFVVQGEVYTSGDLGEGGLQGISLQKLLDESPEYYTFNGAVGALTGDGALTASVGETVRIFFGVGGAVPSSLHMIGEIFDTVSMDGNGAATENRQTIMVPAAGAATLEFKVDYPGDYILVDHTLTRAIDRGAVGVLHVDGEPDASIFEGEATPGSGH